MLAMFPANLLFFQDSGFMAVTRFILLHGRRFQGVFRAEPGRFLRSERPLQTHFLSGAGMKLKQIRGCSSPWPCRQGRAHRRGQLARCRRFSRKIRRYSRLGKRLKSPQNRIVRDVFCSGQPMPTKSALRPSGARYAVSDPRSRWG